MNISQHIDRRTLKRNLASENSNFRIRSRKGVDFTSFGTDSLNRESLAFSGAEAVESNLEGVSSDGFDFCQQFWVPVLYMRVL